MGLRGVSGASRTWSAGPQITLDTAKPIDYSVQLSFREDPRDSNSTIGRPLVGLDKTLSAIGARAAKTNQIVQSPDVRPQLLYVAQHELPQEYEDAITEDSVRPIALPFTIVVEESNVAARLDRTLADAAFSPPDVVRGLWGLYPMYQGKHHYSIPIARAPEANPEFCAKIEKLNYHDLELVVGGLALLR